MQKPDETFKVSFFNKLGTIILSSFLLLTFIPLLFSVIISYRCAYKALLNNSENFLTAVVEQKKYAINNYFNRIFLDIKMQSEAQSNTDFMLSLSRELKKSEKQVPDFIKSFKGARIVEQQAFHINNFRIAYGYHDILFIDTQGYIIYSVAKEKDLGTNLFTGISANTKFAAACKKTLETGHTTFSDYEVYSPSKNQIFSFTASILLDEKGDKAGLIVFQLPLKQLDKIINNKVTPGNKAEAYIIGRDLLLRSYSAMDTIMAPLKTEVKTEQALLWNKHINEKTAFADMKHELSIYKGMHDDFVLGLHEDINILGVQFGLIAEITKKEAVASITSFRNLIAILFVIIMLIVSILALVITRHIIRPITILSMGARKIAKGNYTNTIKVASKNEIGRLTTLFNTMTINLQKIKKENELQNWLKTGQNQINEQIRQQDDITQCSISIITYLAKYLNAHIGAIYITDINNELKLTGSYAYKKRKNISNIFHFGEGLVGQAALEKETIILAKVPDDYITISSGLGEAVPTNIIVVPFIHNKKVKGIIELGSLEKFSEEKISFLELVAEPIAVTINTIELRHQEQLHLKHAQSQQLELEAQQKELKSANKMLEEQTSLLKKSEINLKEQREELRQNNEELGKQAAELEEQTAQLEAQKSDIENKNRALESTKNRLEEKAEELETSSRYKSEFLANMSHELRTPLNSILLLSRLLSENKDKNLTKKQMEFAGTVHSSGTQLLELINEILDLAKIESGKVDFHLEDTNTSEIIASIKSTFKHLAMAKGINFSINSAEDIPERIYTDQQRLEQILKNLLSNALKFTEKGSIRLDIGIPDKDTDLFHLKPDPASTIEFKITDTGIGITKKNQKTIFEAFQQADGTTNRKFGGTGLGLSISRELVKMFGGEIYVESQPGKGSIFSFYISTGQENSYSPRLQAKPGAVKIDKKLEKFSPQWEKPDERELKKEFIPDDRRTITPESRSILIIEDDLKFASILCNMGKEKGFKVIAAETGETGLHCADFYQPKGIILDIGLPGMDGWAVMARLKENLKTKHIPVHFLSASDKNIDAMKMGAVGFLTKPVSMDNLDGVFSKIDHIISKSVKSLLVVENDENQQKVIAEVIGNSDVIITKALTGQEALQLIASSDFDCMILDHGLPDMTGAELLSKIRKNNAQFQLPVIVYTGKELTDKEKSLFNEYSESIILKSAGTFDKLFAETSLFLHRIADTLPQEKLELLKTLHNSESIFKNKKILIVDDDMRNVFALTSILEERGMKTLIGKNGKEGIKVLKDNPDTDLILMDIMMPEMDGYEAIKRIRVEGKFKKIPVIALTAKAMKGDRNKCIKAGASDYLSKPVNTDKLLSMMRVWLY